MPQAQTVAALIIPHLLQNVPAVNIVKPAAIAAVVNIVWVAVHAVYVKKGRNKIIRVVNLLQQANAKPLPKKEHVAAVKLVVMVIAGSMSKLFKKISSN